MPPSAKVSRTSFVSVSSQIVTLLVVAVGSTSVPFTKIRSADTSKSVIVSAPLKRLSSSGPFAY